MNSICLNGVQKYKTHLSHASSRKNLPYWLMCRKTRIFAIVGKYVSFSKLSFPPDRSIWVRMGIPVSLESASEFPTKPSYYNLKIYILKFSPNIYAHKMNPYVNVHKNLEKYLKSIFSNYIIMVLSRTPTLTPDYMGFPF